MRLTFLSLGLLALLGTGCPQSTTAPTATTTPATPEKTSVSASPAAEMEEPEFTLGDLQDSEVALAADHKGNPGRAFLFTGDQGLSFPVSINPDDLPECTLVTWAKFEGEPESGIQQVVSHDDGGFDRSMGLDNRAGQWGWSAFAGSQSVVGGFPVTPGEWTFLAVSYDSEAQQVVFYAGEQKAEAVEARMGSGLDTTSLGTNPSYGEFFTGVVEPVMVFDRVLTEEEITALRGL